jgi:hypothetical protein
MFDIFTNLTKAAIGTVLLPVEVIKDVVMLPGTAYDGKDAWTETEKRLNQITESVDKALK